MTGTTGDYADPDETRPLRRTGHHYPRPLARSILTVIHPEDRQADYAVQVEVVIVHELDGPWPDHAEAREAGWINHAIAGYTVAVRLVH